MPNVDRSEVAAVVAAALIVFAPAIHNLGIDQWINFDVSSTTTLVGVVVLAAAYLFHRSGKAA